MKNIKIEKISQSRDKNILKDMDRFVDWNMSAHPLANLVNIAKGGVYVARYEKESIGMVFAFPYNARIGWIAFLVVDPDYRNKGIGTALMTEAVNFLRSKNIKSIGLYATEAGTPLYERMGFVKILTSMRFTISGEKKLKRIKKELEPYNNKILSDLVEFSQNYQDLLNKMITMDSKIFGANRNLIFENRLNMGSWKCICALNGKKLEACGMWRLIDNYFGFIGPLMGSELVIFQKILPRIILQLIANSASIIYIGTNSNKMRDWLLSHNFEEGEKPLLMFLGEKPIIDSQMWAICHPSKG